jgi:PKD repeat protein
MRSAWETYMIRLLTLLVGIASLSLLGACGSGAGSGTSSSASVSPAIPASSLPSFPLPSMELLRQVSFEEGNLEVPGAVDPITKILLPAYYRNYNGSSFTPFWGPGNYNRDALAHALYGFRDVSDYDRDKTIRLNWSEHQGRDKVYVGVANFSNDRWDWYVCDAQGVATLDEGRFADYHGTLFNIQFMLFVVVVPDNNGPWNLASARLGAPLAPNVTGVSLDSGEEGSTNLTITATNEGGSGSYDWVFGAGITTHSSPDQASQVISLGGPGLVPCSVTVSNAAGISEFQFFFTITPALEQPDITAVSPTSGDSGDVMDAIALNAGGPVVNWEWDFGGGATPNTSTEASPVITLGAAGTYNCSVLAANSQGQSLFNFQLQVFPGGNPPQVVSVSPLSGSSGAAVNFDTFIIGFVSSYEWDFGGAGTPNTSNQPTPVLTLGAPGIYDCTLTASNDNGSDIFNFQFEVTGALDPPLLTAISPQNGAGGTQVTFSATNIGGPVDSWEWDFGGAGTPNTSTLESPTITLGPPFPLPYTVEVIAHNAAGSSMFSIDFTIIP